MNTLFEASPFTGYVYPNETIVSWTVLIVVYPISRGWWLRFHHFKFVPSFRLQAIETGSTFRTAHLVMLHGRCPSSPYCCILVIRNVHSMR
jgi:hypothetical protein